MKLSLVASPHFLRQKKKQPSDLQIALDREIDQIITEPLAGEPKKGALKGIRVHKFTYRGVLYLVAYELRTSRRELYLYALGTHGKFYEHLERRLR